MLTLALLAGCATPAERIDKRATAAGFARTVLTGVQYEHIVYRNGRAGTGQVLHVYDFAELVADSAAHGTLLRNPMTRQLVPLGELVRLERPAEPGVLPPRRPRGPNPAPR